MAEQIVCVDNIGPGEVKKRRSFGVVSGLVALAGAGFLVGLGVDRSWRALLFVPAWLAALGYLQARQRT